MVSAGLGDFSVLSAIQETLNIAGNTEQLPRARVRGYEKPRGAQRSTERAGVTEGIQSAEEGGTALWEARARKRLWSNF